MCLCSCSSGGGGGGAAPPPTGQQQAADLLWSMTKLNTEMANNPDLVILDCRKNVADATGAQVTPYDTKHIAGAYYINFFDFGDPYPDDPGIPAKIENTLETLGLEKDTPICLYDEGISNPQGKVFYNLERLGFTNVHILNGGFDNWDNAGGATDTIDHNTVNPRTPTNLDLSSPDNSILAHLTDMKNYFDQVKSGATNIVIIDYREKPLWDGHKCCPDALRHGHIPHTKFLSWKDYFVTSGLMETQANIDQDTRNAGGDPGKLNVLICNKGWRSGLAYFALRYAGWPKSSLTHFCGGFREWAKTTPYNDYEVVTDGCYTVEALMPGPGKSSKRFAGCSTQFGNMVYCIGGYEVVDPLPSSPPYSVKSAQVDAYNIATGQWSTLDDLPMPISFAAACCDTAGNIYVIGGIYDNPGSTISDAIYKYDGASWTKYFDIPAGQGRYSYAATAIGDTFYMCGGLNTTVSGDMGLKTSYSNEVFTFDVVNKIWGTYDSLSQDPRRCHAMVAIGTKLYVLGGFYKDGGAGFDLNDILVSDTAGVTAWQGAAFLPVKLAGHYAAVANGKIYVPGGWSMAGVKYDVYEYDPNTGISKTLMRNGNPACIGWMRYWYYIGAVGNQMAVIGGFGGSSANISTTQHSGFYHFNQTYVYDVTLPN